MKISWPFLFSHSAAVEKRARWTPPCRSGLLSHTFTRLFASSIALRATRTRFDRQNALRVVEEGILSANVDYARMAAPLLRNLEAESDGLAQYRIPIHRYIQHMVGQSDNAEDLTQDTFLRAYLKRESLRDPEAVLGWLYRIATNLCLDHIRRRKRQSADLIGDAANVSQIVDPSAPSGLHIVQQQEMSACVQRYVECLSDSARTVLLLHDANGLTAPEIANLLDLPLTTVKIRLHRARHLLQRELEKACTFRPDDRGVFVCEPK